MLYISLSAEFIKELNNFNKNERGSHARAKRVVTHSILVLGPSALGKGENYL